MKQELKSERSRRVILDAALDLFSHNGYRATSMRDIADRALVSTGNVYHHFNDKEAIYRALFDEYWNAISDPEFPFNKALATGQFPDNLELIGKATETTVRKYRKHIALIYVDVVEFDGSHIRKFYSQMSQRFERFIATRGPDAVAERLRPDVSPAMAVMFATRFFMNYFSVEILFGVKNHFGKASEDVIAEIADMLRHGMLKPARSAEPAARKAKRKTRSAVAGTPAATAKPRAKRRTMT